VLQHSHGCLLPASQLQSALLRYLAAAFCRVQLLEELVQGPPQSRRQQLLKQLTPDSSHGGTQGYFLPSAPEEFKLGESQLRHTYSQHSCKGACSVAQGAETVYICMLNQRVQYCLDRSSCVVSAPCCC
jgi:hypothetical protein